MLYLALIASLAVGFYASTNSAVMVTENEKRTNLAQMSCESGMDFMNFHLAQLSIPHGGTATQRMNALYNQLKTQLENTGNLGSKTISITGTSISIPSSPDQYIKLDPTGGEFRANVENLSIGEDGKIRVTITGRYGGYQAKRGVRMDFVLNENPSQIFNYGVATKGSVSTAVPARSASMYQGRVRGSKSRGLDWTGVRLPSGISNHHVSRRAAPSPSTRRRMTEGPSGASYSRRWATEKVSDRPA